MVPPERFHRPRDSARAGSLGQGTVIGILFAPRSGEETRARLTTWVEDLFKG